VTECQGCGAWNDTSRTLCVLCGTALAETDEWDAAAELPPLPPLPDGGLGSSMPSWLREPPQVSSPITPDTPPGPRTDPRTFLSDDDFPQWLRDLASRRDAPGNTPAVPAAATGERPAPAWPSWPGPAAPIPTIAALDVTSSSAAPGVVDAAPEPTPAEPAPESSPVPDGREPAAVVVARALGERRSRDPWETLLLVLLFIGVIVAALWALVSNGAFSPGP
jgi:hypothetical protein